MAIAPILDQVYNNIPFLKKETATDNLINEYMIEQMYYLQKSTEKTDAEVETEANYNSLQKMLIAAIVGHEIIVRRILVNAEGDSTGTEQSSNKRIKKAKADVTEVEFDYAKAEDATNLVMKATKLLPEIDKKICRYAGQLGYYLPQFCGDFIKDEPIPFIVVTDE